MRLARNIRPAGTNDGAPLTYAGRRGHPAPGEPHRRRVLRAAQPRCTIAPVRVTRRGLFSYLTIETADLSPGLTDRCGTAGCCPFVCLGRASRQHDNRLQEVQTTLSRV